MAYARKGAPRFRPRSRPPLTYYPQGHPRYSHPSAAWSHGNAHFRFDNPHNAPAQPYGVTIPQGERNDPLYRLHVSQCFHPPARFHRQDLSSTSGQAPRSRYPPNGNRHSQAWREHKQVNKEKATKFWVECVNDWYPGFQQKAYFLPPLHFSRVPYDVENVEGQTVLIPKVPSDRALERRDSALGESCDGSTCSDSSDLLSVPPSAHLASHVFPDHRVPPAHQLAKVFDSDWRDDEASKRVLTFMEKLLAEAKEGMMVLSHLDFRKYLDKQVHPVKAAVIRIPPEFPKPAELGHHDGDMDLLIISRHYGFVVCEIKSVGADRTKTENLDQTIADRVRSAVRQLDRAAEALQHMVSDLQVAVRITRSLMMPNVSSAQLQEALSNQTQVAKELCLCLGVQDLAAALEHCVCSDDITNPTSSVWWQRTVTDHGHDKSMTPGLYEILVARFCGPATSVEVPTVSHPQRAVELKTLPEAVALTGLQMALLTLYPNQVDLLRDPHKQRVFLLGPPGTGKTVVLVLKALQWLHQGKDVHLVSSHRNSRAAILLIEDQLHYMLWKSRDMDYGTVGGVHRHLHELESGWASVEAAVEELASCAEDDELFVLADEAFNNQKFHDLCEGLYERVGELHLWAAAVLRDARPSCLEEVLMKTAIRCPPEVVREVGQAWGITVGDVPAYEESEIPSPTDGPKIMRFPHYKPDSDAKESLPNHTGTRPWECSLCAEEVATLILKKVHHSRKGSGGHLTQLGHDLAYRDVFILCHSPRENLPIVTCLRARGVPVQVVTSEDDNCAIQKLALAMDDAVTVTDWRVVLGLERRVVVVMGEELDTDRLLAMSRTTSLLVRVH